MCSFISFEKEINAFTIYLFLFFVFLFLLLYYFCLLTFAFSVKSKNAQRYIGVCLGLWEKYPALKWLTYQGSGTNQPRDRASHNLVYHDLDKVDDPRVHLGAWQGIINESGRQEYVQSQYYIRPRPENPLDYRAGHRGREESGEFRHDLQLPYPEGFHRLSPN